VAELPCAQGEGGGEPWSGGRTRRLLAVTYVRKALFLNEVSKWRTVHVQRVLRRCTFLPRDEVQRCSELHGALTLSYTQGGRPDGERDC
jgi:hypothetical protein